ncbi:hypothetical protein BDZ91DRAFT_799500 [Kalaharituber pfeilii]|nr:hypothetical protein BDZ91DRAFT_799500 [Kalaharituber pfeilii]
MTGLQKSRSKAKQEFGSSIRNSATAHEYHSSAYGGIRAVWQHSRSLAAFPQHGSIYVGWQQAFTQHGSKNTSRMAAFTQHGSKNTSLMAAFAQHGSKQNTSHIAAFTQHGSEHSLSITAFTQYGSIRQAWGDPTVDGAAQAVRKQWERRINKGNMGLAITWVKGHKGVKGNTEADKAAKIEPRREAPETVIPAIAAPRQPPIGFDSGGHHWEQRTKRMAIRDRKGGLTGVQMVREGPGKLHAFIHQLPTVERQVEKRGGSSERHEPNQLELD